MPDYKQSESSRRAKILTTGLKGHNIPAQGNALGERRANGQALKGRNNCCALSGLGRIREIHTQGVALGWYVWAFQAPFVKVVEGLLLLRLCRVALRQFVCPCSPFCPW